LMVQGRSEGSSFDILYKPVMVDLGDFIFDGAETIFNCGVVFRFLCQCFGRYI